MEEDIGLIAGPFANEMRRLLASYAEQLGGSATVMVKFSSRWSIALYPVGESQSLEKRFGSGETLEQALLDTWINLGRYAKRREVK